MTLKTCSSRLSRLIVTRCRPACDERLRLRRQQHRVGRHRQIVDAGQRSARPATRSGNFRSSRGSPPVSRNLDTPRFTAARATTQYLVVRQAVRSPQELVVFVILGRGHAVRDTGNCSDREGISADRASGRRNASCVFRRGPDQVTVFGSQACCSSFHFARLTRSFERIL